MNTHYQQWQSLDVSLPETPVDHSRFKGLMHHTGYSKYLRQQLLNPSVFVEITSKCNFSCFYCNSPNSGRPKGMMEEGLFRHIVQQLSDLTTIRSISLHIDGEPTIHPKFLQFMKILKEHGIQGQLATNGSTLQPSYHELDTEITTYISTSESEFAERSNISFDAFNEKVVRYLAEWWRNDSHQNINLKVYFPPEDVNQLKRMQGKLEWIASLIRKAGIPVDSIDYGAIHFIRIQKQNGYSLTASLAQIVSGGLFPETESYVGPKYEHKDPGFGFCDSAWSRMTILWDGSIGLCCHGLQGETIYTRPEEIWEKPLKELWFDHPYAKAFRENMERGKLILEGCKTCLSRYPYREFYIMTGTFVPDVEIIPGSKPDLEKIASEILIFGFMKNPDHDGNFWTIAQQPKFGFKLSSESEALPENILLEMDAIAFTPKELGEEQYVDVMINGRKVERWMLSGARRETYHVVFNKELLDNNAMVVTLRFSERKSPAELNIGPDLRKLGMAVSRISVSEFVQNEISKPPVMNGRFNKFLRLFR